MPGRAQHRGHGPSSGEDEDVQDVDLGDAGPSLVDVLLHKAEPPRQATRYAHSAPKAPTAFQRPGGDDARPAQPPRQTAEERQAAFGSFSVGFGASRTKVTPKVTALASNTSNVSHYFAADTGKAPEDTRRRPSSVKLTPSRRPKSSADLMRPPPEKMTIETIDSGSETGDTPTESAKEERPPGPDQSNEHAINLMCLDFLYYEFVSTLLKEWESTEKLHWVREKLDKLARAPPGTETDEWLDDSGFDTDERVYSMDAETRAQIARHDDTQLRRDLRRETLEKREKVLEAKATKCFHRVDKINAIIETIIKHVPLDDLTQGRRLADKFKLVCLPYRLHVCQLLRHLCSWPMSDTIDLEAVPEHYVWHHIARPHPTKYEEEPSVATLRKILEEFIEVSAQFFDFFVRGDREDDEKDPLNALLDEQPRKTSTVYQPEWFEMVALIMSQIAIRTLIDKYDDPDEEAGVVNVDSSPVSPERKEPDELLEPIFHDKVFQSHPLMRDMEAIDPRMSEEMRRDRDDFKNEIIDAFVKEGVQGLKKLLRKPAYSYQRCMRHVESFVRITWKCVENPDEERGVEGLSQRAGVGRPWLVKGLDLHTMGRMQMVSSAFFTSYEDLKKRAEDGAKKYKLVGRAPPKERRTSAGNGNLGQARRVLIKDGDGDDDDDFQPGLKKKPKAKPKPKESTAQELPPVNQRPGLVGALNASAKNGGSKAEALPPKQTKVVSPAISPVKPLPQQAPPLPRRPAPPTQGWKMAHDKVPYLPLNDKGVVSQPVKQLGSPKKGLTHNVNSFMKQRESRKDEIDDEIIVSGDEDFATYGSAKKEKPKPQGTKIIPVDADVGSDDLLVYGEEKRGRENSPDKRGGTSSDSPKPKRRRVGG